MLHLGTPLNCLCAIWDDCARTDQRGYGVSPLALLKDAPFSRPNKELFGVVIIGFSSDKVFICTPSILPSFRQCIRQTCHTSQKSSSSYICSRVGGSKICHLTTKPASRKPWSQYEFDLGSWSHRTCWWEILKIHVGGGRPHHLLKSDRNKTARCWRLLKTRFSFAVLIPDNFTPSKRAKTFHFISNLTRLITLPVMIPPMIAIPRATAKPASW